MKTVPGPPVSDVTLLLEGTYPFVRGGVSSWVHQLLTGLPELRFHLVFVGGRRADYGRSHYTLPANVIGLEQHYLEDAFAAARRPRRVHRTDASFCEHMRAFHDRMADLRPSAQPGAPTDDNDILMDTLAALGKPNKAAGKPASKSRRIDLNDFLFSDGAFEFIRMRHLEAHPDASFVDYFWTVRLLHGPIFQLAAIADAVPPTGLVHSISTGYAGLLGALINIRRGPPLMITEHGIYTKERRIDLNKAQWLEALEGRRESNALSPAVNGPLRDLWVRYFEHLGSIAYRVASPIISLYEGNRRYQIADGAPEARTRIIVNGIDLKRFEGARRQRPPTVPPVIGLVGRVVPIKDVKTFIRCIHLASQKRPDLQGWIIGGEDEDPGYAEECHGMVEHLGLQRQVRFLGHQNVVEILPQLGVLMLTSISEAQPLSVLEAFAAGVPCITTDVGACREQIEGRSPEDRALGYAGRVVGFADASGLAEAALELLGDPVRYRACASAGLQRVRSYYSQQSMIDAYRRVYRETTHTSPATEPSWQA